MSGGQNYESGFSFEVSDPGTQTQLKFSLHYEEACDMFFFQINIYDHRAVGDEASPWRPYHMNNEIRYWITPDRARILFNGYFWEKIRETMYKIDAKRKAEEGFINGEGI